jgi:tyrosine-protein phosphatase SIW14
MLSPSGTRAQSPAQGVSEGPSVPLAALAQKISVAGLPNAGKIGEALFRGAQPTAAGLTQLKQLGITTIVDLRGGLDVVLERKRAEALGFRFIDIPISGWAPPSDEQVAQFLSLVHDSQGEKIFVHCRYGGDRTGVMIAAYRIAENHWSVKQAIEEMHVFGFHNHWHPSMETYIRKFPSNFASDPVFASLRAAPKLN